MSILWTIALVIMLGAAYAWGYDNGKEYRPTDQAWLELEKYKFDKFYEYERWLEERRGGRDVPNA